jgi:hypothetical protein
MNMRQQLIRKYLRLNPQGDVYVLDGVEYNREDGAYYGYMGGGTWSHFSTRMGLLNEMAKRHFRNRAMKARVPANKATRLFYEQRT